MLKNRITNILACLGLLLATSCQAAAVPASQTPTKIAAPATASAIPIPSPTVTPQQVILPTDSIIQNQCPEISAQFIPGDSTKGILAIQGRSGRDRLLNLETGKKDLLGGGGPVVSPSRSQVAYWGADQNTGRPFLVVSTSDNAQLKQLPLQKGWVTMPRWQDDQHLLIRLDSASPPYSITLLNPFTGETQELAPDFPNISSSYVDWDYAGPAAYDLTMDYVVYAAGDGNTDEYILWNISTKTKIASLPGSSYIGYYLSASPNLQKKDGVSNNPPRWSPDDSRVALISPVSAEQVSVDEIFAITKDGQIQRLTYFANHFKEVQIGDMGWSPDGKKIAFWVTLEPAPYESPQGAYQDPRLAILNTETLEITYTCISGDSIGLLNGISSAKFRSMNIPAPIWSPDGKQIVVENRYTIDASRLILLDIASGTAVELGKDMEPTGWMLPGK